MEETEPKQPFLQISFFAPGIWTTKERWEVGLVVSSSFQQALGTLSFQGLVGFPGDTFANQLLQYCQEGC